MRSGLDDLVAYARDGDGMEWNYVRVLGFCIPDRGRNRRGGKEGIVVAAWILSNVTYVSPSYSKTASQPGIYTISLFPPRLFPFSPPARLGKRDGIG